jgi:hypothetical protein
MGGSSVRSLNVYDAYGARICADHLCTVRGRIQRRVPSLRLFRPEFDFCSTRFCFAHAGIYAYILPALFARRVLKNILQPPGFPRWTFVLALYRSPAIISTAC